MEILRTDFIPVFVILKNINIINEKPLNGLQGFNYLAGVLLSAKNTGDVTVLAVFRVFVSPNC